VGLRQRKWASDKRDIAVSVKTRVVGFHTRRKRNLAAPRHIHAAQHQRARVFVHKTIVFNSKPNHCARIVLALLKKDPKGFQRNVTRQTRARKTFGVLLSRIDTRRKRWYIRVRVNL